MAAREGDWLLRGIFQSADQLNQNCLVGGREEGMLFKMLIWGPILDLLDQNSIGDHRNVHFQKVAQVIVALSLNCSSRALCSARSFLWGHRAGASRLVGSGHESEAPAFPLAFCVTLSKSLHHPGLHFFACYIRASRAF